MKMFGWALGATMIVAVAQAMATLLVLALAGALIWALYKAPKETFGFIGLCVVASAIVREPLACVALAALAMTIKAVLPRRGA